MSNPESAEHGYGVPTLEEGYRERRHNNQEYDNTRDGCLPSSQTIGGRLLKGVPRRGESEMKDDE